jgi:hypothetical protein
MSRAIDPARLESDALTPAEKLLIVSLRAWSTVRRQGRSPHALIAPALARRTSARAAAMFAAWVQAVEAAARRPLRPDCDCCGGAPVDLQRLVVACGLAPLDLDLGAEILAPVVHDAEAVMVLARSLNGALADCGWRLPVRLSEPERRTLH